MESNKRDRLRPILHFVDVADKANALHKRGQAILHWHVDVITGRRLELINVFNSLFGAFRRIRQILPIACAFQNLLN